MNTTQTILENTELFKLLAGIESIEIVDDTFKIKDSVVVIVDGEYFIISNITTTDLEIKRLNKQKISIEKGIKSLTNKLNNPSFVSSAPVDIVEKSRKDLEKAQKTLNILDKVLNLMEV